MRTCFIATTLAEASVVLFGLWHLLLPVPYGFLSTQQLLLKRAKPSPESVHTFHLSHSKCHSGEEVPRPCPRWPPMLTHPSHMGLLAISRTCQLRGPCTRCSRGLESSSSTCPHGSFLFAQASAHVLTEAVLGHPVEMASPFPLPQRFPPPAFSLFHTPQCQLHKQGH